VLSLTHRSFAHEAGGIPTNERLEFLGDAVLGLVSAEALFERHPDRPEGDLAKMRAASVSQRALAAVARRLSLGDYILLGKGESQTRGFDKDSILSDTVESLIGAVYLSHGLEEARSFVHRLGAGLDWKTSLQEAAAEHEVGAPEYTSEGEGPDHARLFTAHVIIDGTVMGTGQGTAKKHAEQIAAQQAYAALTGR
jgi:ribonuclease-3